jgi:hypothetical protein
MRANCDFGISGVIRCSEQGDPTTPRCGHADLFAFDGITERRLFAEDCANDKIADQRVDLGSAALELGREGPVLLSSIGHGLSPPENPFSNVL